MPLIEANRKGKNVALNVELDRETHAKLNKYVRYCRADKAKVVAGALELLFKEDKDFGKWIEAHPPRKRSVKEPGATSLPASSNSTGITTDTE
jgi:hypothetical protein